MQLSLKKIVEKLIEEPINYSNSRNAANELYHYFNDLSPLDNELDKKQEHIQTDFGLAISSDAAAFCIIDFIRTRNFIIAIKQAIEDKLAIYNNEPIVVLYAGTGPYASLVLPLTTIFSAKQVQFVLLEINENSILNLKIVINKLAVQDYIISIVQTDASTYCLEDQLKVDILVSETMKPALDKEPQVSIISNLIKQCKADATIIPQSIKINMAFKGKSGNGMFEYKIIRELMDFNAETALSLVEDINIFSIFSDGIFVKNLSKPDNKFYQICLLTYIRLYKNIILDYNESSLTIPFPILEVKDIQFPVSFKIKYDIGKLPRFYFENC